MAQKMTFVSSEKVLEHLLPVPYTHPQFLPGTNGAQAELVLASLCICVDVSPQPRHTAVLCHHQAILSSLPAQGLLD